MTIIDNHSVNLDLLPNGALVLDVGCHGWNFAATLAAKGCTIYALDPAPDVVNPGIKGVVFIRKALVGLRDDYDHQLVQVRDRDGWHLKLDHTPNADGDTEVAVQGIDMVDLMRSESIPQWDLVKLNCEGAESNILRTWDGPWAKQIVVSFHCHTQAQTREECDALIRHLEQWYDVVQHEWTEKYGYENYWDTNLVLR